MSSTLILAVQNFDEESLLKKDVVKFIQARGVCEMNKTNSRSPISLLAPLAILELVWINISMDFIIGLTRSQGKDIILLVVNMLSKYVRFISPSHLYSTKDITELFVRNLVQLNGIPKSIFLIKIVFL